MICNRLSAPCEKLYPGNGYDAVLLYPFVPTALTPKITLSLLSGMVTLSTFPTSKTCVHTLAVVALHTTSYPLRSESSGITQFSLVLLSSAVVLMVTLRGYPGAWDSDHRVARLTLPTRAVYSESTNSIRSPYCVLFSTRTS